MHGPTRIFWGNLTPISLKHPNDIDAYVEEKTGFILEVLATQGMSSDAMDAIGEANKKSSI
jgi:hypothetical protein